MHSELLNLSLFAQAIAKVALMTGGVPGLLIIAFVRCPFPWCILKDFHDGDDHELQIPVEYFDPEQFPDSGRQAKFEDLEKEAA